MVELYIRSGWRGFGFDVVTIDTLVGWRLSGGARKKFSREKSITTKRQMWIEFYWWILRLGCGCRISSKSPPSNLVVVAGFLTTDRRLIALMKGGWIESIYSPFLKSSLLQDAWRAHAVPMWPISRFNGSIQEYFRVFVWRKRLTTNFSQPLQDSDASEHRTIRRKEKERGWTYSMMDINDISSQTIHCVLAFAPIDTRQSI